MDADHYVGLLAEPLHGLRTGGFIRFDWAKISANFIGVAVDAVRGAEMPSVNKDHARVAKALLHFWIAQPFPVQPELFAHGHNLSAKNGKPLVEHTARAHEVIKETRPANGLRHFGDVVKQTPPLRHGI